MSSDLDQLRLLSVFHYVVAGLTAIFSLFAAPHLVLGVLLAPGRLEGQEEGVEFFGWFFALLAGVFILWGWTFAACLVASGRFLQARRRYLFCLVTAAVSCTFVPLGTILGVFTIVVLMRDSVKQLFGHEQLE